MPRIGYLDGSGHSQWYTVERLLRKYASIYGIKIFVYASLSFSPTPTTLCRPTYVFNMLTPLLFLIFTGIITDGHPDAQDMTVYTCTDVLVIYRVKYVVFLPLNT